MKRLSVLALTLLTTSMLLYGCGKKEEIVPEETVTEETTETETEEISEPVEEGFVDDEEIPEGMVRSQLTNEFVDKSFAKKRPMAIMINNIINATPHSGLSQADVMYECIVEGSYSRLMAIFEDWENVGKIGPVRSCRDYFVYWAYEWDAIYAHFGGPELYVKSVLGREETDNLNGISLDGLAFYRTNDRPKPHNSYTSGSHLVKGVERKEYSLKHTENYRKDHFNFTNNLHPNTLSQYSTAIDAAYMAPGYLDNKPWFEYNAEDGLYYRYQFKKAHTDVENGQQLAYKNVIFQNTYYETRDKNGYLAFKDHDDTRDGYYFTNGKAIHIRWKKSSDFSPTVYYDDDLNEITLNPGKTFICIVQDQKSDLIVVKDANDNITLGGKGDASKETIDTTAEE